MLFYWPPAEHEFISADLAQGSVIWESSLSSLFWYLAAHWEDTVVGVFTEFTLGTG